MRVHNAPLRRLPLVRGEAMSAARDRIIARLDAIDTTDPERAHSEADDILLYASDALIAEAYQRVIDRCSWSASA
jgi:hypothetical protein